MAADRRPDAEQHAAHAHFSGRPELEDWGAVSRSIRQWRRSEASGIQLPEEVLEQHVHVYS